MSTRIIAGWICCGLLASVGFADETTESEATADKLFQDGRKALFQGRYDDAVKLLSEAVAADTEGEKTIYRLQLARAFRYANQPEESEKLLDAILKKSPDHVEAGQLLAEILYTAERWKDLEGVLKPLLRFRHDYPTYHMLAEATFNLDNYEDAQKYFKEAIKLNPRSAPDQYQLANIFLAENRFALAAHAYEEAIRLGTRKQCSALQTGLGLLQSEELLRAGLGRDRRIGQSG